MLKILDGNVTRSKVLNVTIGSGSADRLTVNATVSDNTTNVGEKITFTAHGIGGKSRLHIQDGCIQQDN